MKFLHHATPIFETPLKNATLIHDIRMNVQEKFKIRIVQITYRPELHTCGSEALKRREKVHYYEFLHEIVTHNKNKQSMHGSGKTQEGRVMSPVVGLFNNLPMLS